MTPAVVSRFEIPQRNTSRCDTSSPLHDPVGGSHGNPHPKASSDCRASERGDPSKKEEFMPNLCVVGLMSAFLVMLLSPIGQLASAEERFNQSRMALIFDSTLNSGLPTGPIVQRVASNLCGIGLGGYCPGGYRACLRSGTPKAECDLILARCDECNQAMVDCREKVGVEPGYTCAKCRKALYRCRARMSVVPK
jgi:hypothetical protein